MTWEASIYRTCWAFNGLGGVTVQEDTLMFSPEQIAHVKGHILAVERTPAGLTLHFGRKP